MKAIITKEADKQYSLNMEGRIIGGSSKSRLMDYAKKQGASEFEMKDETKPVLKCKPFDLWR